MHKRSMVVGVENRSGWVGKRKMMYRARDEVETMTRATELESSDKILNKKVSK